MRQTIRRRVPFSPLSFFSVVLDVPSYHLFLPFCVSSSIVSGSLPPSGPASTAASSSPSSPSSSSSFTAQLTVGFRIFTESYVSEVTYAQPRSIHIKATESAIFRHLVSAWTLAAVPDSPEQCDVSFSIDFLVRSAMHAGAVKMFFGDVTEQQMSAFMQRCAQLNSHRRQPQQLQQQPDAGRGKAVDRASLDRRKGAAATASANGSSRQTATTGSAVLAAAATKPAAAALETESLARPPPAPQPALTTGIRSAPAASSAPVPQASSSASSPRAGATAAAVPSPAIEWSPAEVEELRLVFRNFALGLDEQQAQRTASEGGVLVSAPAPSLHQMVEEAQHSPSAAAPAYPHLADGQYVQEPSSSSSSASSPPLLLSFPAFQHACAFLAAPSSSFLSKYRERAALRACAEDEHIALAAFTGDHSLYRYDSSGSEDDAAGGLHTPVSAHSHPLSGHHAPPAHLPTRDSAAGVGKAPARARPQSQPLQFGRFLEVVWLLSRATNAQKLQAALRRAAAACASTAPLSPPSSLPLQRLRAETLAVFAVQLGIIRHVMPAMVVRRSREMDREMTSTRIPSSLPSASPALAASSLADPTGRGLYVLALVGVMDSVLAETEKAIADSMRLLLQQVQLGQGGGQQQQGAEARLDVSAWCEWWERQAELLTVMTVAGQSSLITWSSAAQTAEAFAEQHRQSGRHAP